MRILLKHSEGINVLDKAIKSIIRAVYPVYTTTRALINIPQDPAKRRAKEPSFFIYTNIQGKYPVEGQDSTHYFLFLTDNITRYTQCARYSKKRDLPKAFQRLHRQIKTSLSITIRNYRFDSEFNPRPITQWLVGKGVGMELIEPYTHYQNGAAERPNRTVWEKSAAMLQDRDVIRRIYDITVGKTQELLQETRRPKNLQPEVVKYTVQLKNRLLARALRKQQEKTPQHTLHKNQPLLARERVQGSRCQVTIPPKVSGRSPKLYGRRGQMGYQVSRFSESINRIYYLEKYKVFKVRNPRVEDRQGLDDAQPEPTYHNRVPLPNVEIPEYADDL